MNKIELLAPAGSMDSLIAAIEGGANAVYLGGKKFSARSFSNNFSNEELLEAINYSHLRNVKVYAAVNTIILESELEDCKDYINELYNLGVDGIIVQDFGILNYILKNYQEIEVHTSTQMSIDSINAIKYMENLGVDRVVVARENSIEDIREFRKNTDTCLEVFVSGALCVSYSGQCLISSFIGGRSGNRGTCSQICRKTYKIINNETNEVIETNGEYLLSPKDLMTVNDLDDLIKLDNLSLKLEGRMKRSEYVFHVAKLYRKLIDGFTVDENDILKLKKLFNRGFTKGFLFNDESINNNKRPNHIGISIGKVIGFNKNRIKIKLTDDLSQGDGIRILGPNDVGLSVNRLYFNDLLVNKVTKGEVCELSVKDKVLKDSIVLKTTDSKLMKEIVKDIENSSLKIELFLEITGKVNDHLFGSLYDDQGNYYDYKPEYKIEESIKYKFDEVRFKKQVSKTNDYPFKINIRNINVDSNSYITVKQMNEFRRSIISGFVNKKLEINKDEVIIKKNEDIKIDLTNEIICSVNTLEQYYACKELGINVIYLKNLKFLDKLNDVIPITPRMNDNYHIDRELCASNYSRINKNTVSTNFSLNITNSDSIYSLHKQGVKRICLSHELNKGQIEEIQKSFLEKYKQSANLEMIIYGYQEAMIMKYCPVASSYNIPIENCKLCDKNSFSLIDSHNAKYKLSTDNCITTMMFNKKLNLIDEVNEIKNYVPNIRIDFYEESYKEVIKVINNLKKKLDGSKETYFNSKTDYKGHYYKGIL
ncbi:U32 family peptidase [Mycoplasmatota bacterium WC44]